MTTRAAVLLRRPEDPRPPTFLELLFDVVFVLAFVQLSQMLVEDLSWSGGVKMLMLLLPLSVAFAGIARAGTRFDPRRLPIQLLVLGTMLGTLGMASATPKAFGERGLYFAGAYVVIQIGGSVVLVCLLRGHEAQRIEVRRVFWYSVSAVPWIIGGLAQGWARVALWALAVTVDYAAAALRLPTPGLGRASAAEFELSGEHLELSGEHLADRYRQLFIIGLGELVLVTGLTFDSSGFRANQGAAVVAAFATTALLWRIYIYRAGELMAEAMTPAPRPVRVRPVVDTHLIMVAGIIAIAVGYKLVIEHPLGHTQPAWIAVILGGPALFLAGRTLFEYAVFGHVSWTWAIGVLVLAAISPAMFVLPPLGVATAAPLVLAGVAVADTVRSPRRRPQPARAG